MGSTVGVIYFSGTGKTATMAEAIIAGAESVAGNTVHDLRITGDMIEAGRWNNPDLVSTIDGCDAVIFGTPTYMGGPAAQFKTFADALATRSPYWAARLARE